MHKSSYFLAVLLSCLMGMVSLPALSAADDGLGAAGLGVSPEFLPVEEAYQLSVNVADDRVVLDWYITPGYYLYRERMGLQGRRADGGAVPLDVSMSAGVMKYDDYFERDTELYFGHAHVEGSWSEKPALPFTLTVESQGCAEAGLCYPPQQQHYRIDPQAMSVVAVPAPVADQPPAAMPAAPAQGHVRQSLPFILLMAMMGGLILNLMPCVFPVLSLKVFAMAAQRERDDEAHWHSWVYAAGVILTFVLVAGVMLLLRAGGEAIGWGFQLQEPLFIGLLVYLFFVLGLSFSGVVQIGGSLMGIGQGLVAGSPVRAAFFTGVLAVVVASPCSVPFMGVALGYAITQSAAYALLVFAVLGFGMALPFILLAYWPRMLHSLPAPGPWMERLRQLLAFPLYATALWLLWVLGEQAGQMAMVVVLGGLILLVMAGWLWRDATVRVWEKVLAVGVLVAALVLPHAMVWRSAEVRGTAAAATTAYTPERLAELRADGKPVFVNLTAAWCLTCLVNEKTALYRDSVQAHLRQRGITYLKGDWTNRDPDITALLQQYDRSGVPLYLYFPAGKDSEVVVLPQVLTETILLESLR